MFDQSENNVNKLDQQEKLSYAEKIAKIKQQKSAINLIEKMEKEIAKMEKIIEQKRNKIKNLFETL